MISRVHWNRHGQCALALWRNRISRDDPKLLLSMSRCPWYQDQVDIAYVSGKVDNARGPGESWTKTDPFHVGNSYSSTLNIQAVFRAACIASLKFSSRWETFENSAANRRGVNPNSVAATFHVPRHSRSFLLLSIC